jgi:DNA (cytosine-5)-methyltransferase 1
MQRVYYIDYNPTTVEEATTFMEKYIRIRRLTPLECWKLMGISKEDYLKAESTGISESKLYERSGRGIVIPMLEDLFRTMFEGLYEKNNK